MDRFKRILLVEDDSFDIKLILTAFEKHRLTDKIDIVNDGVEALNYLQRIGQYQNRTFGNPSVILLDLKMPRMDGLQVIEQLKKDKQLRFIPIVVLTSSRQDKDLSECYKMGVNAFVVKPLHYKEFQNAVEHLGIFWALINEPLYESVTEN